MQEIPLSGPPGYDYETTGPWWICHIDDENRAQAWTYHEFESAVWRFWMAHKAPKRRVMVDSYGVTVMGTLTVSEDDNRMSGTRQTMEATLRLVTTGAGLEGQAKVLAMIEGVQRLDGQAI